MDRRRVSRASPLVVSGGAPDTEETAPRGEPIRVLAKLPRAAVVPFQPELFAVFNRGF